MYIPLDKIKKHLNIDNDFKDDDEYLADLEEVACVAVQKHIDRNLNELDRGGNLPAPITQAILLMIGTFYNSRESVAYASAQEVPLSYNYLLDLFKNYNGCQCGTNDFV